MLVFILSQIPFSIYFACVAEFGFDLFWHKFQLVHPDVKLWLVHWHFANVILTQPSAGMGNASLSLLVPVANNSLSSSTSSCWELCQARRNKTIFFSVGLSLRKLRLGVTWRKDCLQLNSLLIKAVYTLISSWHSMSLKHSSTCFGLFFQHLVFFYLLSTPLVLLSNVNFKSFFFLF